MTPDQTIHDAVLGKLVEDPVTHDATINVSVVAGNVRLQGTVDSPKVKEAAESLAGQIAGVGLVVNSLEIRTEETVIRLPPYQPPRRP